MQVHLYDRFPQVRLLSKTINATIILADVAIFLSRGCTILHFLLAVYESNQTYTFANLLHEDWYFLVVLVSFSLIIYLYILNIILCIILCKR